MFNADDAVNSPAFKQALKTAGDYLVDHPRVEELLAQAAGKLHQMKRSGGPVAEAVSRVETLIRLVKAYLDGSYQKIPIKSLVAGIGALIYFVMGNDLVSDDTPFVGYMDDAAVILVALKAILGDIEAFEEWEHQQPSPATH
jgi:uncharacterized membrane protein YkvA (DUF1232 family)